MHFSYAKANHFRHIQLLKTLTTTWLKQWGKKEEEKENKMPRKVSNAKLRVTDTIERR